MLSVFKFLKIIFKSRSVERIRTAREGSGERRKEETRDMAMGRAWEERGEKRWRTGLEVRVNRERTSQAWWGERRERE